MQRTLKVDAAARQKMRQIEIQMNAEQQKADGVGICDVDCLLTIHSTRYMYFILQKNSTALTMLDGHQEGHPVCKKTD